MAVYTHAFIATREAMMAGDFADQLPDEQFPTLPAKGVDAVKLLLLDAIVRGEDVMALEAAAVRDPSARQARWDERIPCVRDLGGESGTGAPDIWIHEMPQDLVRVLATLTAPDIGRVGTHWARMWEWRADSVASPELTASIVQYLRHLCQLAARAAHEDKRMYLWVCV